MGERDLCTRAAARAPAMTGVVVRTLDESELIGECLDVLARQSHEGALDVVVVDSGSTDGTVEIARDRGARVVELAPGEFDYSRALNLGIEEARGDVVVSISAHAIPVDDRWLERMLAPFADDRVAGVASRQVPWPGAPWQEVHRLGHQFPPRSHVAESGAPAPVLFSNAASAIRRSVWAALPFTLPAAEDLDWAERAVAAGWRIVYEADASVFHSHDESPRAQALRMIDINRASGSGGRLRPFREAAGIFARDGGKILGLEEPFGRKVSYLVDLAKMAGYYAIDYTRVGTTAERRREDVRRSQGAA